MRARWRRLAAHMGALCLLLCVAACEPPPTPTVYHLRSATPSQLNTIIAILLRSSQRPGASGASVQFHFTSIDGHVAVLTGDERMTCNGQVMTRSDKGFDAMLPLADVAGKTLTCVYTSGAATARIGFLMPGTLLRILSPSEGARVARGKTTLVEYQAPPGRISAVWATDAVGGQAPFDSAITPTQATIDTTSLDPGPGSIAAYETLPSPPLTPALLQAGFHSLLIHVNSTTTVDVVWV